MPSGQRTGRCPDVPHVSVSPESHPGFEWLNEAACGQPDVSTEEAMRYFVDAGKSIADAQRKRCRFACPVRRECVLHAYLGGPNGTPIAAGYLAGFSLGQRRTMTLKEALAVVAADTVPA